MTEPTLAWMADDHRRRAKRRAQWRDSKRRQRMHLRVSGLVAATLHSLGCRKPYFHQGNRKCVPIPMFRAQP